MPDQKELRGAARRNFRKMTPKQHKSAYEQLYESYVESFESFRPRDVDEARDQMASLLTFGRISDGDRRAIEASVRNRRLEGDRAQEGQTNTSLH